MWLVQIIFIFRFCVFRKIQILVSCFGTRFVIISEYIHFPNELIVNRALSVAFLLVWQCANSVDAVCIWAFENFIYGDSLLIS